MTKRWRRLVGATLVVLLLPIGLGRLPAALACSCLAGAYEDDVAAADVVFDGVATERIDANPSPDPTTGQADVITWRFDVSGAVKGTAADPQDVGSVRGDNLCGTGFEIGVAYRVFARREGASLSTGSCSGNRVLSGYRLAAGDGGVFAFGASTFHGSAGGLPLVAPVVGIAATPSGRGYWLAAADGGVFAYGDARFFGSAGGQRLNARVVGITPSPTGAGYWLAAADGGVFAYGDARFFGSAAALPLSRPVVGIAAAGSGTGYWLLGSDGGVFAYGNAGYLGRVTFSSAASAAEGAGRAVAGTSPVFPPQLATGITATHAGTGYWIAELFGVVHGFGDTQPVAVDSSPNLFGVVGIARTSITPGLVIAERGGDHVVHNGSTFGNLEAVKPLNAPIVAVTA
jgi:hypothetical protein